MVMFPGERSLGTGGISNVFYGIFSCVPGGSFLRATWKCHVTLKKLRPHTTKNAIKTFANATPPGERSPDKRVHNQRDEAMEASPFHNVLLSCNVDTSLLQGM